MTTFPRETYFAEQNEILKAKLSRAVEILTSMSKHFESCWCREDEFICPPCQARKFLEEISKGEVNG